MNIDFDKIKILYGIQTLDLIVENIEDVKSNIFYLTNYNFDNIDEIFECCTLMFICDTNEFKNKIDKFIFKLGNNYIEKLENDMGLWSEIE